MVSSGGFRVPPAIAVLLLASLCGQWLSKIAKIVPDPYLDEVFHVRQAQVYCDGRFDVWDPKITTPPGLYLLSTLVYYVTGRCDIYSLRALNCFATCMIVVIAYKIIDGFKCSQDREMPNSENRTTETTDAVDAHVAANVGLFPPAFFFSALYYTDVVSTAVVLLHYYLFLRSQRKGFIDSMSSILLAILGVIALFNRQTNIFWVAVFPAGLTLLNYFGTSKRIEESARSVGYADVLRRSWRQSELFSLPVHEATFEDYVVFLLSLTAVILRNPMTVIRLTIRYLVLLAAFGAFVVWNGSVVLGDKSNHVATIHFPQMLYFWPYLIFFALPLAGQLLLSLAAESLPSSFVPLSSRGLVQASNNRQYPRLSRLLPMMLFVLLGLAAVHFNTVIHPFTLADNRHYVFYVFRILRRHTAIKYIVVPIYVACGWLAIQLLGSAGNPVPVDSARGDKQKGPERPEDRQPEALFNSIGFVVVWLVTTALSTVTAPLVEPRYFILPWIIWRIHAHRPSDLRGLSTYSQKSVHSSRKAGIMNLPPGRIGWLCLEAMWYLLINMITGYLFLYRGFSWPQEPGNVQRFLW